MPWTPDKEQSHSQYSHCGKELGLNRRMRFSQRKRSWCHTTKYNMLDFAKSMDITVTSSKSTRFVDNHQHFSYDNLVENRT